MFWEKKMYNMNFIERPRAYFPMKNDGLFYDYYVSNPIVYRAVSLYIKAIIALDVKNTPKNWTSILIKIIQQLMITGNVFITEDWNIIKHNIQIIKSADHTISYKINNKYYDKRLLHIKLNDHNEFGISPLSVAQKAIEAHGEVSNFILSIMQNGGKPSGILTNTISYESQKNTQEKMTKLYDHINRVGSFAVMEGDYKWQQLGISPEKLELIAHKTHFEREIAIAFDIPPLVLGIVEATYANYKEARAHFFDNSIYPTMIHIINLLNEFFSLDMKLNYNYNNEL